MVGCTKSSATSCCLVFGRGAQVTGERRGKGGGGAQVTGESRGKGGGGAQLTGDSRGKGGGGAPLCASASVSRCKKVWNLNGGGTHAAVALHDHAQEHGLVDFHPVLPLFSTGGRGGALTMWQLNCDYTSIHCVAVVNAQSYFEGGGRRSRRGAW